MEWLSADLDRDLPVLRCSGRCLRDEGLWEGCRVSDCVSKSAIPFARSGTAVGKHTALKGGGWERGGANQSRDQPLGAELASEEQEAAPLLWDHSVPIS